MPYKYYNINFLLLIIIPLAITLKVQASCNLRIDPIQETSPASAINYNVFNFDQLVKSFEFYVHRIDDADNLCNATVTISSKSLNHFSNAGSSRIHYQLKPDQYGGSYVNNQLILEATNLKYAKPVKLSYLLVLDNGQFPSPGLYQDQLSLDVYDSDQLDLPPSVNQNFSVSVNVDTGTRINFVGVQGRSHTLDFGELKTGGQISLPPQLLVQSTGGFSLRFSSQNLGALRHKNGLRQWDIPYQLELGKQRLELSSPSATINFSQSTPPSGLRLPLKLNIPEVKRKPAGIYSDIIRIVVSPTDLDIN